MTTPRPHEVHTQLADLLAREELEAAFALSATYMERLDDDFLRFNYLCLATRLGRPERTLEWLEASLGTDHWFSAWFLRRSPDLEPLHGHPCFQRCLQALEEEEKEYWRQERMKPIILTPESSRPPHPLLVGLHGHGYNTMDAAQQWSCVPQQGWLATFPLAPHLVTCGKHWWGDNEENAGLVMSHVRSIRSRYSTAEDKLLLSGFSKGGEIVLYMTLRGYLDSKAFLTIGAGPLWEPERWRPIIEAASPKVRGVMMCSPYDLDRTGKYLDVLLPMLADHGITCRFIEYDAEGHVFPGDFDRRFREAVQFLFAD